MLQTHVNTWKTLRWKENSDCFSAPRRHAAPTMLDQSALDWLAGMLMISNKISSTFNHVMEDPCRTRLTLSLATQLNYAAWPGNAACSELRGRRRRQPVKVRSGKLWEIRTTLELETRPAACVCTSLVTQLRQSPAAGPTWRVWAEKSRFCWSDGESATGRKITLVGGKFGETLIIMIW